MNKKKVGIGVAAGLIVLAGAAYTTLSWYTGDKIKALLPSQIESLTQKINSQPFYVVNVTLSNYQKGIFATDLTANISISSVKTEQTELFAVPLTIYHGPLPWNRLISGNLSPKLASVYYLTANSAEDSQGLNLNSTTNIDYSGTIDSINHIKSGQFTYDDVIFKLGQNVLNIKSNENNHVFEINGYFNDIDVTQGEKKLTLKNVDYRYQKDNQQNIIIEQAVIANRDLSIALNQLILKQSQSLTDKELKANIEMSVQEATYGKQSLGSGSLNLNYSLPISLIMQNIRDVNPYLSEFMEETPSDETFSLNLEHFEWKTKHGDITANLSLQASSKHLNKDYLSQTDQNDLLFVESQVNIPFKPIGYLVAQLGSPNDALDDQTINKQTKYIAILAGLFSPRALTKLEEDKITADIYYNRDKNQAIINGKTMDSAQFWRKIYLID